MKSKATLVFACLSVITAIIIAWPTSTNVPLPADVESAINSIEPLPAAIPANVNSTFHKIIPVNWVAIDIKCAFPKRDKKNISRNNLKSK